MFDIQNFIIDKDYVLDIYNNNAYNKTIFEYYEILYNESEKMTKNKYELSKTRGPRLLSCNNIWLLDKYDINQIKDFRSTNLCKDKFCSNCKKVKQAARMSKYVPELEQYKNNLYHLVLTVPNVNSNELKTTIESMNVKFKYLIRYLNNNKQISGLDFSKYGYLGAVRSLEITFNDNDYHPHFHVGLVLSSYVPEEPLNINQFSFSNKTDYIRKFTNLEILIQKIWYLLINNEKVNTMSIENLEVGYSCILDKFNDNDYQELFKYMTKSTNDLDKILSYENFKTIYLSTHRKKQIQGYGCLFRITDEDLEEEVDRVYADIQLFLSNQEIPQLTFESPRDILFDNNYQLISRKKIYQYLKDIK